MIQTHTYYVKLLFFILFIFCSLNQILSGQTQGELSLKKLTDGNNRYLNGNLKEKIFQAERKEQVTGQKPYAIILTCSDSRVPPEIIFDEDLGDLFVIRVAGNVVDEVVLGSIEYAVEHLNVSLLVVMGHTNCGAIKACFEGGHPENNVETIIKKLHHSVNQAKIYSNISSEQMDYAIKKNVTEQIQVCVNKSETIKSLKHEEKLLIVGGLYDIESGQFSVLENK